MHSDSHKQRIMCSSNAWQMHKLFLWDDPNDRDKRRIIKSIVKAQKEDLVCLQETKIQSLSCSLVWSLGVGRFLEWALLILRVWQGVLVFWDSRVLELTGMEIGDFSVSYWFKNVEDGFCWIFTVGRLREDFWEELGTIRGLWQDPWCIGGDFNVIRFLRKMNSLSRLSSVMRRFSEVIEDMELRDLPL